jgi:hypothetical protein
MNRVLLPEALDRARGRLRYAELLPPDGQVVVVQGNNTMTPLAEMLAQALDEMAPELQIVTVSVSPCHGDQLFAEELRSHSARRTWNLPITASLEEVAATIAGADCFLGVSLHGAITAVAYGRPSVTYDPFGQAKLAGFAELAGMPDSRTGDPVEAAKLVAQFARVAEPATRLADLQRPIDAYFDSVAELVERHDPAEHPLAPVTWADTAAPLQLGLRRLPRPVAPAPATKLPSLRRPALAPTIDDLSAAVDAALAAGREHSSSEPDEHDEVLLLRQQNNDLRGAIAHLEGVVAQADLTEAELRAALVDDAEARALLEEVVQQARASRIFRLSGRPRALGAAPD